MGGGPGVSILCYHSLDPGNPRRSATPEGFRSHIGWLRDHCELVPLSVAATGRPGERPRVAITFDDGFADQHRYALPVLGQYEVPATFFLTTGRLESTDDRAPGLARLDAEGPAMDWPMARDLVGAGMEVGAHTHRHPNLAHLDASAVAAEMALSRRILADGLGVDVRSFAYPYGRPRRHHTDATRRLAASEGFERAVAVWFRRVTPATDPYCIPRFAIQGDDLTMLGAKISGRMDIVGRWQASAPSWAIRASAGKHY